MRYRSVIAALLALGVATTSVSAATVNDWHRGTITNISGACDVSWEHVWYVDTHFTSEVLEVSSCGVVQNVVRLTDEDLGAITVYGPQQNSYSYVNWPSGAIAFSWQKVCGDLVCKQKT